VIKAMAKDRNQRYQSAGQLARDLRVAITGQMPDDLTLPAPTVYTAAPSPTLVATPTTASLTPARPQPAAVPDYALAAPTTASMTPPHPLTAAAPGYAPTAKKKAGGTSPLIYIGLGVAGLVVLCVAGIAVATALGLFKPGGGTATPQVLTPQVVKPSPGVTLLAAPALTEPADSATFLPKDTIRLSWKAVSGLAADDSYVVTLECASGASGSQKIPIKETSYTVQPSLYDSLGAPYQCRWNVMVTAQSGAARSASSQTWQFSWSQPAATATVPPSATRAATPTSTSASTATPRPLPTNTRPPAWTPTPAVSCTGDRIWNGAECVCPPDKPDWLNGQCLPKGGGGGGGGGEPPPPPH
jgi:hypothetical protein